jgi:tetrahydromethanopterin S-methyltransferase subunit B
MKYDVELKYGLGITVASLLWLTGEMLLGLHDKYIELHPTVTLAGILIPIAGAVYATLERRSKTTGAFTWREAFVYGLVRTAIVTLLAIPSQYVFHKLINPAFFSHAIAYSQRIGYPNPEAYFNLASYMRQAVVGSLIMGVVLSAALAAIYQRPQAQD